MGLGNLSLYLANSNFGTIQIKKDQILTYHGDDHTIPVNNVDLDDGEWHNLQIIIDTDANQLQFVRDKTTVVARKFTFRADVDKFTGFFLYE